MTIDKEYVMANYPRLIDDIRQSLLSFKQKNKINNSEDDEAIIGKAFYRIWKQVKNGVCESPMGVATQTWQDIFNFKEAKKNGLL